MTTRLRKTGIRFNLIPQNCTNEDIKEWMHAQRKLTNYASKHLLKLINRNEEIFNNIMTLRNHKLMAYAQNILRQHAGLTEYRESLGLDLSINERISTSVAARFYNGYAQRNGNMKNGKWVGKKPKLPAVTRQDKAIHITDYLLHVYQDAPITITNRRSNGLVDIGGIYFELRGLRGQQYRFTCSIPEVQFHLLKFMDIANKSLCCGNIFFEKDTITFIKAVDEIYELQYDYETILGIDFNRRHSVFITMNDGDIEPRHPEISILVAEVINLDKLIHTKGLKAKQRQAYRNQWKLKRQELRTKLLPLANKIITKAKQNKSLLAIDNITLSESGTFGYAECKEVLLERCRQEKIPFILVPTPHTSSDCSYCFDKGILQAVGRSPDKELVSCTCCQKNYHADINAARLIAVDGQSLFNKMDADMSKKRVQSERILTRKKKQPIPAFISYDVF